MFVNTLKKFILLVVQYKYSKSYSLRFNCPNLILRTKLCGTMFIQVLIFCEHVYDS